MDSHDALKGVVDKSGFPLQVGISHLIDSATKGLGWRVQYAEHAWRNVEDDLSGFIDLVLENASRNMALVVECKRVQEVSWVFLSPHPKPHPRRYARAWVSQYDGGFIKFGWDDFPLDPPSVQSDFCCVFGQDAKSIPMLERVGSTLVSSTEALAKEEKTTLLSDDFNRRAYLNVIVTTAKLKVCSFDPSDISLKDGTISKCTFDDVPYVRFQKQLSIRFPDSLAFSVGDTSAVAKAKENTVFVVNSESLLEFVQALNG